MWINDNRIIFIKNGYFIGITKNVYDPVMGKWHTLETQNIRRAIKKMGGSTWTNTVTGKTITV